MEIKRFNIEGVYYLDGEPISIELSDGRIHKLIRKNSFDNPDSGKTVIAPGFIDNQVNGCLGIEFSSKDLTVDKIREVTHRLWQAGVTTYFPTLTTNSKENLLTGFEVLTEAIETDPELGRSIPGFHLEGPYISSVAGYRGMHDMRHIHSPDWDEFMEFCDAAGGQILQVTLAPELDGALEFIKRCREQAIVVGLGHHNAPAETIHHAVDAGAKISTHLGNGCADRIHRHRNPFWSQLADDRLAISIICDGFHLLKEEVQTFYKTKGAEQILLTSDAGIFAGMQPGRYKKNDKDFEITNNGLIKFPSENVLAGSASFIDKCIRKIMQFTDCSLANAVHMATQNQARFYGLKDRGEIAEGKQADLVLFKIGEDLLEIQKTYLAGELVYDSAMSQ